MINFRISGFPCRYILVAVLGYATSVSAAGPTPTDALVADEAVDVPPAMRRHLDTIHQYSQEVARRTLGSSAKAVPVMPPSSIPSPGVASAMPAPTSTRPATTRDPFEVSPQLREGRGNYRYSGSPGANVLEIQRSIRVRAVVRNGSTTIAQLLINNKDTLTVMNQELIDLADFGTYEVQIQDGTVSLHEPGNKAGKRVVLR